MKKIETYTERQLEKIPQLASLNVDDLFNIRVIAQVLPFRVNNHVIDGLIDWSNIPNDPIYQLVFPQLGMLEAADFTKVADVLSKKAIDRLALAKLVHAIRAKLNPHPANQQTLNVPMDECDKVIEGVQHKYRETVLFFPSQGQVCHAYCTFCFRWAQFIGDKSLMFAAKNTEQLFKYLSTNKFINNLLVTGGDPMIMKANKLANIFLPLLHSDFDHIQSIRIGTKALTYWPYRFTSDADADELLRLIETITNRGKHIAIMVHLNHWREIDNPVAEQAIKNLRNAGAIIRSQGPVLAHINDSASVWKIMWEQHVKLGIVPYYMFVERDTGANNYFELPLVQAYEIYRSAFTQVSGLARTVRGPSMSASPGKIEIQGIANINNKKALVCRFLQARTIDWVQKPFFAEYSSTATWIDQLKPLTGEKFFFEDAVEEVIAI